MHFSIRPVLENEKAILYPLQEDDFESLYAIASDPAIWAQHPNPDRWKKEVFRTFFEGAIQSGGAFKIVDKASGEIAGSTRIYGYDPAQKSIFVGYTFFATAYWGTGINPAVKETLLDYLFQFVTRICFQIGAGNTRSQIAIGRLGAQKTAEETIAYFGEAPKLNFVYCIEKEEWKMRQAQKQE